MSKRAVRRISLRNKTSAFVTSTAPASSSHGTEICFKIRIDTPTTPTVNPASEKGAMDDGEKGTDTEEEKEQEREKLVENEEKVPNTTGKSSVEEEEAKVPHTTGTESKEQVKGRAAPLGKARSNKGSRKTRAKNS